VVHLREVGDGVLAIVLNELGHVRERQLVRDPLEAPHDDHVCDGLDHEHGAR
jgi:hypothetical protein